MILCDQRTNLFFYGCFLGGLQHLGQAALAPGGVVLVNDAFFSGAIQLADGFVHSLDPGAFGNGGTSHIYGGAGAAANNAIANAFALIATNALLRGM
jgi:hypothetical protein